MLFQGTVLPKLLFDPFPTHCFPDEGSADASSTSARWSAVFIFPSFTIPLSNILRSCAILKHLDFVETEEPDDVKEIHVNTGSHTWRLGGETLHLP